MSDSSGFKKVLVCCDDWPFPPRSGVTIPIAAYIRLLRKFCQVDCVVLCETSRQAASPDPDFTAREVGQLFVIQRARRSRLRRAFGELMLGHPAFHGWHYIAGHTAPGLDAGCYDVILASPISALDFALTVAKGRSRVVAAISDCYSAVLDTLSGPKVARNVVTRLIARSRAWRMTGIERRILMRCHSLIVQTDADLQWLRRIGGMELLQRAVAIPNGVAEELLVGEASGTVPDRVVLYVADFRDPLYLANLRWFLREAWTSLRLRVPGVRLRISGRGADRNRALQAMLNDRQIEQVGFTPALSDVYRGARVAIAPIFKGYGFINKVAEAFASGIPVVGDESAFNGQRESVTRGCCTVASSADEFVRALESYLTDDMQWRRASLAAKSFASEYLDWQARAPVLARIVGSPANPRQKV